MKTQMLEIKFHFEEYTANILSLYIGRKPVLIRNLHMPTLKGVWFSC